MVAARGIRAGRTVTLLRALPRGGRAQKVAFGCRPYLHSVYPSPGLPATGERGTLASPRCFPCLHRPLLSPSTPKLHSPTPSADRRSWMPVSQACPRNPPHMAKKKSATAARASARPRASGPSKAPQRPATAPAAAVAKVHPVGRQRMTYSQSFKLDVVRHSLRLPATARIKPTCPRPDSQVDSQARAARSPRGT